MTRYDLLTQLIEEFGEENVQKDFIPIPNHTNKEINVFTYKICYMDENKPRDVRFYARSEDEDAEIIFPSEKKTPFRDMVSLFLFESPFDRVISLEANENELWAFAVITEPHLDGGFIRKEKYIRCIDANFTLAMEDVV